jgi:peptidoglycan-N-acetylglucosamine deacetylase
MISHTGKFHQFLFPSLVWRIKSAKIFLTFDDGPHPMATPRVLNVLKSHNVHATFFLSGNHIAGNEKLVSQISNEGHSIGIHGYTHTRALAFSKQRTIDEIQLTERLIHSVISNTPKIFRPPFGFFSWNTVAAAKQLHYRLIMWSCLTGDFQQWSNEKVATNTLQGLSSGSILVFHDNNLTEQKISSILNSVIPQIKQRGFEFGVIE